MQLDAIVSKRSGLFNDDWNDACLRRRDGEPVTKTQADSLPVRQLVQTWSTMGRGTFELFCRSTSVTVHQPTILWIPIPIASPKAKPSMKSHITVWGGWYANKASSDWTWTQKLSVWTGISEFWAPGSPKSLIWQSQWWRLWRHKPEKNLVICTYEYVVRCRFQCGWIPR